VDPRRPSGRRNRWHCGQGPANGSDPLAPFVSFVPFFVSFVMNQRCLRPYRKTQFTPAHIVVTVASSPVPESVP